MQREDSWDDWTDALYVPAYPEPTPPIHTTDTTDSAEAVREVDASFVRCAVMLARVRRMELHNKKMKFAVLLPMGARCSLKTSLLVSSFNASVGSFPLSSMSASRKKMESPPVRTGRMIETEAALQDMNLNNSRWSFRESRLLPDRSEESDSLCSRVLLRAGRGRAFINPNQHH